MTERPILFSGPMVRALLAGRKTQTRRIVKEPWYVLNGDPVRRAGPDGYEFRRDAPMPYGALGDRLWVKEAIRLVEGDANEAISAYVADDEMTVADAWPWKLKTLPAMFCPRGLSRIELDVLRVRVERLGRISNADCRAEGMFRQDAGWTSDEGQPVSVSPRRAYEDLWYSINGAWDDDCWVWVIEFAPTVKR